MLLARRPRPDGSAAPGFHHLPLTVTHKPVARALPWTGVAPKGVPGGGGLFLGSSGRRSPLPTTPKCPQVTLSPGGPNPPLLGLPLAAAGGLNPAGGGRGRELGTLEGEDPEPSPPGSPLGLQSKQKPPPKFTSNPDPPSLARTSKELEEKLRSLTLRAFFVPDTDLNSFT